jgi:hypothetical protein
LPFEYEADLRTYSQSLALNIGLESEPDDTQCGVLKDACQTWLAQCLQGGYISPTYDVESFFLSPDDDPLVLGKEVQWGLDKVQIDSRAFNGLTNFFVAFSDRFVRVTSFEIE